LPNRRAPTQTLALSLSIYIYICIYIEGERERERELKRERERERERERDRQTETQRAKGRERERERGVTQGKDGVLGAGVPVTAPLDRGWRVPFWGMRFKRQKRFLEKAENWGVVVTEAGSYLAS
jgi:hypothetical protein